MSMNKSLLYKSLVWGVVCYIATANCYSPHRPVPLLLSYCPGVHTLHQPCSAQPITSGPQLCTRKAWAWPPTLPTLFIWLIATHPCRLVSGTPFASSIPRAPFLQTSCHLPGSTYLRWSLSKPSSRLLSLVTLCVCSALYSCSTRNSSEVEIWPFICHSN